MRGKNKSLLEDALIFLVIGVLIYFAYSFFFSSNEEIIEETNTNIIENKIGNNPIEPIKKEEITLPKVEEKTIENRTIENKIEPIPEPIKKEEMVTPKILEKSVEVQKSNDEKTINTSIKTTNIVEKKVEIKEIEKPITPEQQSKELDDKAKVDAFYKTIKDKIYFNIDKDIDKTQIKKGEFVNIRLTIFKDGRFEQLTLIEGNNQNFELIKSSITQAFPVIIDDSIKANFPRYFRMKIEF